MKPQAIIFDMDGTLIDNNPYHIMAWQEFYRGLGRELTMEHYKKNMNGKVNREIFEDIFSRKLTTEELADYIDQKESLYRKLYEPHIAPISGLMDLLQSISAENIPMAVATSGLPVNIQFAFDRLSMRHYFEVVVDSTYITRGKPNPEIYLKAAELVKADPAKCVAFEDAIAGIKAAKGAGMRVVALSTTHAREDLGEADLIINDYRDITLAQIKLLLN
ncbi:HAD family phosphatase [Danxiaibacter flavus]|uniref:HAD family phosphatase n=1 Tax=Danxiaibacter flavus TaxID=3049108 RepID=A0ABV3ZAC9_9BACT|nr:HAD family phosphatase [Chitinophagaceae bacterium DXS]